MDEQTDEQTLVPLRRISGVAAAYIVGPQGVLAGAGSERLSQAQGSLLAAIVGALRQATTDLGVGELGETIMEAEQGAIVAGTLPDNRAAVVLAQDRSSLGMIRVELRRLRRGT
jgi:predicted regulator of Ras-like GTPase activity (Roadblock/LC7/MglB family)